MRTVFALAQKGNANFLGSRFSARQMRSTLEANLGSANEVEVDFSTFVGVTQSFVDELIGALILKYGPDVMRHLIFKGCSEEIKSIIHFVVHSRVRDYKTLRQRQVTYRRMYGHRDLHLA